MHNVEKLALEHKPKTYYLLVVVLILVLIDFKKFRSIADKIGSYLMVDMAHFSGLVAGTRLSKSVLNTQMLLHQLLIRC